MKKIIIFTILSMIGVGGIAQNYYKEETQVC